MNQICLLLKSIIISGTLLIGIGCTQTSSKTDQNEKKFNVPKIAFSPKKYIVFKSDAPIEVDGRLDEEVWNLAKWSDKFVDVKGNGEEDPMYDTKVKLLWDGNYIYVGAVLQEDHLWATMTERNSPLYLDNAFEIFIDPDRDTHNYAEFEINAWGTIWDLFLTMPYRDDGQRVNEYNLLDYQSAVHLEGQLNVPEPEDEGWTLEYAIPISSIMALNSESDSLTDGDQWKVNFQRAQRRLEVVKGDYQLKKDPNTDQPYNVNFSVWSPQGLNNIHYPEMWGIIQFSEQVAGDQKVQFINNIGEEKRWILRQAYYQMKEFHLNHGYYTNNLNELNMDRTPLEDANNLTIETTQSLFEISLAAGKDTWHITQGGKVWKD